ncbi:hypothetical protein [Shinella sumterensis]|uniref:Uncharacterized protein n=1 Tax=Shinella sumterensis TaxID=1967501 RepID=A0AA50CME7_9HYPH|nr:hypothetical protein [Shinella sumterensis]WLR98662.1 hypothetical protein Q9313_06420 [Shinella sumterensis]
MIDITRESAARRSLKKQGYSLRKTPARSNEREAFGVGYMVVDDRNTVVLGANNHPHSATLDEVEAFAATA